MKLPDDMGIAVAEREKVRLTSPNRAVLPDETITKGQIVAYYDAVAERMLPHISRRALSLEAAIPGEAGKRYPAGTGIAPIRQRQRQGRAGSIERERLQVLAAIAGRIGIGDIGRQQRLARLVPAHLVGQRLEQ